MVSSRNTWRKWCPNGCGKKAYFIRGDKGGDKPYYCEVCKKRFTKEQMKDAN